jgi:hypothetical protein
MTNLATITGGAGGQGGIGFYGQRNPSGTGGAGVVVRYGSAGLNNFGTIAGGIGGAAYYGSYGRFIPNGATGDGITLYDGGSVNNAAGAVITGGIGALATGTAATIVNDGRITGIADGVYLAAGGYVRNAAGGRIAGGTGVGYSTAGGTGVNIRGGSLVNAGAIGGGTGSNGGNAPTVPGYFGGYGRTGGAGVVASDGDLTNSAVITGGAGGAGGSAYYGGAAGAGGIGATLIRGELTNRGTITGGAGGVGGNQAAGFVNAGAGGAGGAGVSAYSASLVNFGTIAGGVGGQGGLGPFNGVNGTAGVGVTLTGNSVLTNAPGGIIEGYFGVYAGIGADTVVNYGTIAGISGLAVDFAYGNGTLVIDANSDFQGGVFNAGPGTLVLGDGGTLDPSGNNGSFAGVGDPSEYRGFSQYVVATGADWRSVNTSTIANGTTLTIDGTLTGPVGGNLATVYLEPGGGLTVGSTGTIVGGGSNDPAIALSGPGGTITLDPGATLDGAIAGFVPGDAIDLAKTPVFSADYAHGTLSVNGTETLDFTSIPAGYGFATSPDGQGGTDLTLLAVDQWTGPNGDWSNGSDWSTGLPPGSTMLAEIVTPVTVTLGPGDNYSAGAGVVDGGATLDIATGAGLTMTGELRVEAGNIVNSGQLDATAAVASGSYLGNQTGGQIVGVAGAGLTGNAGGAGVYLSAGGSLVNNGAIAGGAGQSPGYSLYSRGRRAIPRLFVIWYRHALRRRRGRGCRALVRRKLYQQRHNHRRDRWLRRCWRGWRGRCRHPHQYRHHHRRQRQSRCCQF